MWRTDGTAQGTAPVQTLPLTAHDLVWAAGRFYFTVEDSAGEELWTSDGTEAGTARVADINPGPASSFPTYATESNGRLFFSATDASHGSELWALDLPVSAPAAPSSLSAAAVSGGEVALEWADDSPNEAGFVLERSDTADFESVSASISLPAGVTRHLDTGLSPGATYHYRVQSFNRAGASTYAEASAATPAAPAAPASLVATAVSHARVELAWPDSGTGEQGYRVERSPVSTFDVIDASFDLGPDVGALIDTSVSPERHYFYRVFAVGPAGRSPAAVARATTPGLPPTGFLAWGGSPHRTDLQWVNPQSQFPFLLEVQRAAPGEPFLPADTVPSNQSRYFDLSRVPETTYRYRVRAVGPFGASVWTEEVAVRTPAPVPAALVKDLNTVEGAIGSDPSPVVVLDGVGYFSAVDAVHGRELWRTDGTTAGTWRVFDVRPGGIDGIYYAPSSPSPGEPDTNPAQRMVASGGAVYLYGEDGTHGPELWRTDGTAAGTRLVADAVPGRGGLSPQWLTDADGTVFFVGGVDRELWKSDGTAAGTVRVKDIRPGPDPSGPHNLVAHRGVVYFSANDGQSGLELWRSDGTEAGTYRLSDVTPGGANVSLRRAPTAPVAVGDTLFFTAYNESLGRELWKTDGTVAGTVLVTGIPPGAAASGPSDLVAHGGVLLFTAIDGAGEELWRSDGTAAGTMRVTDLNPGPDSSYPTALTSFAGKVYFFGIQSSFFRLFETDGTPAGTRAVTNLAGPGQFTPQMMATQDALYFMTSGGGVRLWKSDGTAAGTVQLSPPLYGFLRDDALSAVNGVVLFPGHEAPGGGGAELWRSDGTPGGTFLLKNIRFANRDANPANVTAAGGYTYFTTAEAPGISAGLWRTDGTDAGTVLLRPGQASKLTAVGSTLYLLASDAATGTELWKTDGTAAGTVLVKDVTAGPAGTAFGTLTAGQTKLYFTTLTASSSETALWVTDGTAAGTTLVSAGAFVSGTDFPARPTEPVTIGDTLYFRGRSADGATGLELWKSDGTAAGTVLVKDTRPGNDSGRPFAFTNSNGTLFFATDGPGGTQSVWKSDGTEAGTVLVRHGFAAQSVRALVAAGGTVYFNGAGPDGGAELWKTDGTPGGTVRVADLWPGPSGSSPAFLTAAGGTLYFLASDPAYGLGLWKTDGTGSGTVRLRTVYGPISSYPFHMFSAGETLYYADAGQLWRSDGTPEGTTVVLRFTDTPAEAQSLGRPAAAVGDTLYVRAYDPERGRELWRVGPAGQPAAATVVGRHTFYAGAGNAGAAGDAFVASDKVALLPGQTATRANYTTYSRGLSGVTVDLLGLAQRQSLSPADFALHVRTGSTRSDLTAVPVVDVLPGAGVAGSDRVVLLLPPHAVRNTWLRVTVKANGVTGLSSPDVFYFGNLVGDTGDGGDTRPPLVGAFDLALTRANFGTSNPTAIGRYDFNRDGAVNAFDVIIVRQNQRRVLPLMAAPAEPATAVASAKTISLRRPSPPPVRRSVLGESHPQVLGQ